MRVSQRALNCRRFSWPAILRIRAEYKSGKTQTALAKKNGVSQNSIRNIVLLNTYKLSPSKIKRLRKEVNKERLLRRRAYEKGLKVDDVRSVTKKKSCQLCGTKRTGKHGTLHIDHKNKRIRGLLCMRCNLGLGFFRDSIVLLKRAVSYLKENS